MSRALAVSGLRRGAVLAGMVAALLLPATSMPAPAEADLEYKVKAAFLFNFARFVIWPPDKFPAPDSPIELCVLGNDPFGATLDETVRDKTVASHPLRVRRANHPEALRGCQIAYIGNDSPARVANALEVLAGNGVLTVHEAPETLRNGVVRFLIEDRKVRFEINAAAAAREELQLSAKLLAVAYVVKE